MSKKKTLAGGQAENDAFEIPDELDLTRFKRVGRIGKQAVPEPPTEPGKTRITIRIDQDILDWFFAKADQGEGQTGYRTLINNALREYTEGKARA